MIHPRPLTREDLLGCTAISYNLWLSPPQEKGSTKDRQEEVREHILTTFGLTLDRRFTDAGLSASKGHHRTRGEFGDILRMAEAREFRGARPVVLIVEASDRLFREGVLDSVHGPARLEGLAVEGLIGGVGALVRVGPAPADHPQDARGRPPLPAAGEPFQRQVAEGECRRSL